MFDKLIILIAVIVGYLMGKGFKDIKSPKTIVTEIKEKKEEVKKNNELISFLNDIENYTGE